MVARHDCGTLTQHWNGSAWSVDSSGAFTGELFAATVPGAAGEWAVGVNGGNQGLVLTHG